MFTKFTSITLCCVVSAITFIASGYENTNASSSDKNHAATFLSLHNQYCEKAYDNHESLTEILAVAPDLSLSSVHKNVYEVLKNGISYAVSPEKSGCTTDVMLKTASQSVLFSFEEINQAILEQGYIETGKVVYREDTGNDQTTLTVLEKKYISPKGEVTVLDFPMENKDKYYMTFFAEKFAESKQPSTSLIMAQL